MIKIISIIISILMLTTSMSNQHIKNIIQHDENKNITSKNINIYGLWKLENISGGISGKGKNNDFDLLELQQDNRFNIIKSGEIIEKGKFKLEVFDKKSDDVQIIFESDLNTSSIFFPKTKYIHLDENLNITSPCCDMFNHHFSKYE